MSTNIFVNKSDRIEVKVWYRVGDNGDITVEDPASTAGKPVESLTAKFRKPDFESVQRIIQASTVFDNGMPVVDVLRAGKAIMYHLIDSWDVKDDKGVAVPCDTANINALHPAIGNALSAGVQARMGNLGQIFS